MSFSIEFQYEVEQLGIVLNVTATYENGGGGVDEPAYGPECTDISAVVIDDNDQNDEDVWEGLAELYEPITDRSLVWVQGTNGWHVESVHTGMRADHASYAFLPRSAVPQPWQLDQKGRQFVRKLVCMQDIIQDTADDKASEAEADGAGGPDPDELHDRLQDERE